MQESAVAADHQGLGDGDIENPTIDFSMNDGSTIITRSSEVSNYMCAMSFVEQLNVCDECRGQP
jgi:hypothetical protein